MSRWYRAYEGTVTDAKLGEAAMIAGCSRSVAIAAWHCLLEGAASKNNCGSHEMSARRVAVILCEPLAAIEALMAAFDELGMTKEGAVAAWKKRQFQSDDSKERVRKHREKRRNSADVTVGNGDVTPPETETDTDSSEPKGSSPRPWVLPAGVSLAIWTDFLTNRKRKRLVNTASTWKAFLDDLARIAAQTGIPPPKLIEQCTGKGWGGIYDPRDDGNGQSGQHHSNIGKTAQAVTASAGWNDSRPM